ncbi:hypothetical protein Q8F55_008718 [Vanrija albida]|uniref:SGNH domain-containing protein n=1 Tax=Vanrija albida TaxID=181172 RepID=A0ABR3PRT3_9TREE
MTATPTRAHAARLLAVCAAVVLASVLLLDTQRVFSERPYTHKLFAACPAQCPSDPFTRPGMLHWSPAGLANETRWVPFPSAREAWDVAGGPNAYDLPKADSVPSQAWDGAAPQLAARLEQGGEVGWLRGRTVLLIGSSHDRNNVQQLCDVLKGKYYSWGGHTGGYCHAAEHDLVLVNWFLYGMVDVEGRYPPGESPPNTFERRFAEVLVPKMAETGLSHRSIDLVVATSLFWDDKFLSEAKTFGVDRAKAHGLLWHEAAWFRHRLRALFAAVRALYPHAPLMFRTRQLREVHSNDAMLRIFQLDQAARAVAAQEGVALFTWGSKLEGYTVYYDHDQHFALGPNTYVFGDMLFFYLHRAITPGCWECHERTGD